MAKDPEDVDRVDVPRHPPNPCPDDRDRLVAAIHEISRAGHLVELPRRPGKVTL